MENKKINRPKCRLIAFYLPQFHPISENDAWWGKGFTEWTNVGKARPMFRGHYQPHVPADLGYYDLRVPEVRVAQAEMAKEYGIEGFCYWHYWFGNGKCLLERPFNEVLKSGKPNFPFCLAWANQTWTGIWHGAPKRILIEQTYPGTADHEAHFYSLLDAFCDERYMKIDGKPIFVIYDFKDLPESRKFIDLWQSLARRAGLKGIYFVAHSRNETSLPAEYNFDAIVSQSFAVALRCLEERLGEKFKRIIGVDAKYTYQRIQRFLGKPQIYLYKDFIKHAAPPLQQDAVQYPCVFPNWDNTPRSGKFGVVLQGSTPELFKKHLCNAIEQVSARDHEKRIVFIKSWNEWAEGNYLEPDLKYGKKYLEMIRENVL